MRQISSKIRRQIRSFSGFSISSAQLIATLAVLGVLLLGTSQTAQGQVLNEKKALKKKDSNVQTLDKGKKSTAGSSFARPKRLMFADCTSRGRNKGMWLLDEKGDTLQHVSSRGGYASWSYNHMRMVCIDPRLNMKILSLENPSKGVIINTPKFIVPEMPDWSPRANVIAFGAKDKYGVRQIFRVNADSAASDLEQLTNDTLSSYMPTWNADGTAIIYNANHNGQEGLYSIPAKGGKSTPFFISDTILMTETTCSPDGKYLVGTNRADGNIYRLDADGTNPFNLTKFGTVSAHFGNPQFIDKGKAVIFAGKLPGGRGNMLFKMAIEPEDDAMPIKFRNDDGLRFTYASPNW